MNQILQISPAHPDKPGTATGTRTEESNVDIEIDGGVDLRFQRMFQFLAVGMFLLIMERFQLRFKREDNTYRIGIGVQDMNKKDWTTFEKVCGNAKRIL